MASRIVSIALIVFLAFDGNSAAPGVGAPTTNEQCDNGLAMGTTSPPGPEAQPATEELGRT